VVVEELLQLLVGVVDQQLLERVLAKDLETRDVEDADERRLDLLAQRLVDLLDEPEEQAVVQRLGERVARVAGLLGRQVRRDDLTTGADLRLAERVVELLLVDLQQVGDVADLLLDWRSTPCRP
jgi:hypothetical protein